MMRICTFWQLLFRLILYKTTSRGWVKFKNDTDQKAKVEETFGQLQFTFGILVKKTCALYEDDEIFMRKYFIRVIHELYHSFLSCLKKKS